MWRSLLTASSTSRGIVSSYFQHRTIIQLAHNKSFSNLQGGTIGSINVKRFATAEAMSVSESITSKLTEEFNPEHLNVINESHMHNVPRNSETHFKVIIVSDKFQGLPLIKRHRAVNSILKDELDGPVHALSIQAKTPEQWSQSGGAVPASPQCMGGSKR
eukprot:m.33069 g.33069  ORF g.33069 m.33069 type:complete len:160 (+) comp8484_c0_seq2:94-573(+)